jgi:hypothetical protein
VRLKIIRQHDLEEFTINSEHYGSYILDAETQIPRGSSLDITAYEYSGRNGGYQTSSRIQRRPFDLIFHIRENYTSTLGLFELIRQAQSFFIPNLDDLTAHKYTIEFYSNDRNKNSFMMRHGTITVPLDGYTQQTETKARTQLGFAFGDPYLYPIGDSGIGITTFRLITDGSPWDIADGREWEETDGAIWDEDDGKSWITAGGDSTGSPVAVNIVSSATVGVELEAHGQLINPQIVNLTNGSIFRYNGTVATNDVLTVDTTGEVLYNGSIPPATWSGTLTAIPGSNTYILQGSGGNTGYVDVTIRGAF